MKKMGFALLAAVMLLSMLLPAAAMAERHMVEYMYGEPIYKTYNKTKKTPAPTKEYYEAGSLVKIPLPFFGVYMGQNEECYYEIVNWLEINYAPGEGITDVDFIDDGYGRYYMTFTMPNRDVLWLAQMAERYVVEYRDLVGEAEVMECTPGEATPVSNGDGSEPVRRGYKFLGWSPKPEKEVTKSQIYTAIWEMVELKGKSETVKVGNETFEEAIADAAYDDVIVLNMEKAQDEHDSGANDKKDVTAAKLEQRQLEAIAEAGKELVIEMTASTVTFDQKALDAIHDQIGSQGQVDIEVYASKPEDLSKKQQAAISNRNVDLVLNANITAYALKGNEKKEIHDFEGGSVEIEIPYVLPAGMDPSDLVVLYIADDGTIEEVACRYENNVVTLKLNHFSSYVFTRNSAPVDLPQTGDNSALVLWLSALAAAAAAMLLRRRTAA